MYVLFNCAVNCAVNQMSSQYRKTDEFNCSLLVILVNNVAYR